MWIASYWLGIAGAIVLLTYSGAHPIFSVLLALVAPLAFMVLAKQRNGRNNHK